MADFIFTTKNKMSGRPIILGKTILSQDPIRLMPVFLGKLRAMIEDPELAKIVGWSEDGELFIIYRVDQLE